MPLQAISSLSGLFGEPPPRLAVPDAEAVQFSPLSPGAAALEDVAPGSLGSFLMRAAAGTLERHHDLAVMLRALAPGASFIVLAPKDAGGSRLARELEDLGVSVEESAKAHHRICRGTVPPDLDVGILQAAITQGAPRLVADLGLWSQPGVFSWDAIDPGTALLLETLPPQAGQGADLGCGIGILAHAVLASAKVTELYLVDIDRRAVEAARRNVVDPRVRLAWADVKAKFAPSGLDFVVMNPPFHHAGQEQRSLGQIFIRRAADSLRRGGRLWLVANRHLPYEEVLKPLFRDLISRRDEGGFKVIEAVK